MNWENLVRAGIVVCALGYFAFFRADLVLLDCLYVYLLTVNALRLAVHFWTLPGRGTVDLHQQILQEEQAWWGGRQAAKRQEAK